VIDPSGHEAPSAQLDELTRPVRRRPDPILGVIAGVAVGIGIAAAHHARPGMYVVAAALALGAVLRLFLRPRAAGSLVVRSRRVDVMALLALAVAVASITAATPFRGH
jgi:DUF3017 family protein